MYEFGDEEIEAATRVLSTRRLFRYLPDASESDQFEAQLARKLGSTHSLLVSSGTAALMCGLAALGIGPGDEVLIPAYGFVANALAPLAVGAVPVVCEIDESLTLDPRDLQRKLTARSRAVMPVHVHGFPCDIDAIVEVARLSGMAMLEDACQAIGGTYRGRHLGTIGDMGAFSFNQHKIMTAGEGGALVTDSTDLYERAFMYHDGSCSFSRHRFDQPAYAGLAFRASEISAAILRVQLERLDGIISCLRSTCNILADTFSTARVAHPIPSHDPSGACGTHLAYSFGDEATAHRFMTVVANEGIDAFSGVSHGHAFIEWALIHERRGAHHPLRNPLLTTEWRQDEQSCPRTSEILSRTVLVRHDLRLEDRVIDRVHRSLAEEFG